MAITLEKLCEGCREKYQMQLVAGQGGMNNTVRWVHMVEDREVPSFLHGNELVFTTGIAHISGEERLISFVKNLKACDASGVVVNIGPYIGNVPERVIQFCNENDFPIFTLPWKVHIIDITYDFCSRIIENKKKEVSLAQAFESVIRHDSYISEYHDIFERAGFTDTEKFRILTIEFFLNEKCVTEMIVENNNEKLWGIFKRDGHPTAMYVDKSRLIVIRQRYPDETLKEDIELLKRRTRTKDIKFFVGVSGEAAGFIHIRDLFSQAGAAEIHGFAEKKTLSYYDEIGTDKIICAAGAEALRSFVESSVGRIKKYDEENGTNLTELLKCYMEYNGSVQAVAEKLKVHRNTVNHQIGRIKNLFEYTFNEADKAEISLAFRILKLNEGGRLYEC